MIKERNCRPRKYLNTVSLFKTFDTGDLITVPYGAVNAIMDDKPVISMRLTKDKISSIWIFWAVGSFAFWCQKRGEQKYEHLVTEFNEALA